MQDRVLVQVLQAQEHASNEKLGLLFAETAIAADMVTQVAARHQVNDEVQVFTVLKRMMHVDEERVMKLAEELLLIHD